MRAIRNLVTVSFVVVCSLFGLALASTRNRNPENRQQTATLGYKIKGTMEPVPGHSFPKSWGRVVTYFVQPSGNYHRFLVFEAEDGTIRMVRVDLDWDKHRIEDVDVITIGRD